MLPCNGSSSSSGSSGRGLDENTRLVVAAYEGLGASLSLSLAASLIQKSSFGQEPQEVRILENPRREIERLQTEIHHLQAMDLQELQ
ncbi:unnamed protein product, partial [Amoebophrya sp. A25]|eukprot:GSA25T00001654001.1